MDRRDFLHVAALAGLAFASPVSQPRRARAEETPYTGPLFVTIHAGGGWDPIFLTDPKLDPTLNRRYTATGTANGITYAKIDYDPVYLQVEQQYRETYRDYLMTNETFFTKNGARTLVINGLDTTTNNHDSGTRAVWSGRTMEGYPAFAALAAGVKGGDRPMSFLSGGGFDATVDVVPLTRIGRMDVFERIAYPNRIEPSRMDTRFFNTPAVWDRIMRTQKERMAALQQNERLPRVKRAVGALYSARTSDVGLQRLQLPDRLVDVPGGQLDDLQGMMQQAQVACSAFKAGLAVSASFGLGGFDTHGTHDRNHMRQLMKLMKGVDFLLEEAARQGVADRLFVMVGSDFGRGPHYNGMGDGSGKDHWPITTMMFIGPGIRGGRVIGGTDERVRSLKINPGTLALDPNGVKLQPEHIHRGLRKLVGLDVTEQASRFPLAAPELSLFA